MIEVPADVPAFAHTSVLADEVVAALAPRADGLYVDLTAGGGGHALALLTACPDARVLGFDRDPAAVRAATARLAPFGARARVVHATFDEVPAWLEEAGVRHVDGMLADLGVSSPQLDEAERGMSFRAEGPLDMRMDPTAGETALELIARLDQDELADVLYQLGEERRSRRIARCVKQALAEGKLATTLDLRRAVVRAVGPHRVGGVDPATRTFQGLRIAVNGELEQLDRLLEAAPALLAPGAPLAIISFHSLEDRRVKRAFQQREVWTDRSKKPILAGDAEREANPRARSAKLRVARRAGAVATATPEAPC